MAFFVTATGGRGLRSTDLIEVGYSKSEGPNPGIGLKRLSSRAKLRAQSRKQAYSLMGGMPFRASADGRMPSLPHQKNVQHKMNRFYEVESNKRHYDALFESKLTHEFRLMKIILEKRTPRKRFVSA